MYHAKKKKSSPTYCNDDCFVKELVLQDSIVKGILSYIPTKFSNNIVQN